MKKLKKLGSMFLALAMALALAIPAMAATNQAEKFTLTIPEEDPVRSYQVYQVFTGTLSGETNSEGITTNKVLSNVKWGSAGTGTAGEAVDSETLKNISETDKDALAQSDVIKKYVDFDKTYEEVESGGSLELAAGYYVIKEVGTDDLGAESASTYIVQLIGNITFQTKTGTTQFDKKVEDKNDTTGATSGWQDSADYDIGDPVPFQLTATLPENADKFEVPYKLVFHDQPTNLEFQADSVTVHILDADGNSVQEFDSTKVQVGEDDYGLTFTINDVKTTLGLNSLAGAKIAVRYNATLTGDAVVIGNPGNPNKAYLEFSNNPYVEDSTGETPDDKVVVFTYQTVVNKIDKDKNALQGAGFTLQKNINGVWTDIEKIETDGTTTFTFKGLDDGDYKLIESKVPVGYNKIEDICFTISAKHDEKADEPKMTELKFELTEGEADFGDVETTTSSGTGTTDVMNLAGVTLPETGGMGTTIFYAVGGVLVLGAVVFLVTKKRVGE